MHACMLAWVRDGCRLGAGPPLTEHVPVARLCRVYAYTSSAVQQAILRFFVRCDVLLPNLFVGSITRESVMEALESGTSGEQIVEFLRSHAHPRTSSRSPQVPIVRVP